MRRVAAAILFALCLVAASAFAQTKIEKVKADAGAPKKDAGAAQDTKSASDAGALPPGHPSTDSLPSGHPPIDDDSDDDEPMDNPHGDSPHGDSPHGQNPHGENPHGGDASSRFFKPPPDTADDDPALPLGTIVATIKDAHDKPVPFAEVTLGILHSSVAKGDSRERKAAQANDAGMIRFDGLEYGSGTTYRIIVQSGPAQFADEPFALGDKIGKRAVVHVYDVTTNIDDALVGMQGLVYLQLREDAIVIEEMFSVFNVGSVAWVADERVGLPAGFHAFNKPDSMDDVRFDEMKSGAALRGTISPGRHDANFRFNVSLDENEKQTIRIEMPPHVAQMRVIAEASKTMGLVVGNFPSSVKRTNRDGKRLLVTERQVTRQEGGMPSLEITLTGLPTRGSGRWVALAIAALAVIVGFLYLQQSRAGGELDYDTREDLIEAREALLGEIVLLEKLHKKGDIGPKTYARLRTSLFDALARIVSMLDEAKASRRARAAGQGG